MMSDTGPTLSPGQLRRLAKAYVPRLDEELQGFLKAYEQTGSLSDMSAAWEALVARAPKLPIQLRQIHGVGPRRIESDLDPVAAARDIADKARAYIAEQAARGITVSAAAAVAHVLRQA